MKDREDLIKAQQDRIHHIFDSFEKGKEVPVGTITTQGGVRMQKVGPGKWKPMPEGHMGGSVSGEEVMRRNAEAKAKKNASAPMHYRDMNKEQLHSAAEKLGIKNHKDLDLKNLRRTVGDAIVTRNIQQGIAKMKENKK